MPLLTLAVVIPLAGAVLAALLPARLVRAPRLIALGATALALVALAWTLVRFDTGKGMQLVEEATWIPSLDVAWRLGVDGLSLSLSLMSAILFVACAVYGVGPKQMTRAAAGLLLLMESSALGFFLAQDFFLFYVAFDVTLVGMYFMIALWGSERRRYAAIKFFLYTLIGSLPVLLGIIVLFLKSQPQTFDMIRLAREQPVAGAGLVASLTFLAFFIGFAIKTPIVPVHTWLPAAHVEAPTVGSVLLAGVLLKMGTYGLVRVNLMMMPDAFARYALAIALLGLFSVFYGALLALAQTDLKRLVAYTSINHMGYVVIGVAAAASTGISTRARDLAMDGAVLQMIAHGFVTGGLFFIAGFIQSRTKTRDMGRLGGLMRPMPLYGSAAALAFFASLGLPGLAQFPAELQIFLGTLDIYPAIAALAVVGVVITAGLFLLALQRVFLGETPERWSRLPDLGAREAIALGLLMVFVIAIGLYPRIALDVVSAPSWL